MSQKEREKTEESLSRLNRRVGGILRKERLERKLSLREVSVETTIAVRYLEALENDDFNQFPGQTYAIGFLSNYADYLNLDRNALVNLFHQQQMDELATPLKELTRPNSIFTYINYFVIEKRGLFRYLLLGIFVVLISGFLFSFFDYDFFKNYLSRFSGEDIYCGGEREVHVVNLALAGGSPAIDVLSISPPNALRFSIDDFIFKFCLDNVDTKDLLAPLGTFHVRLGNDKNYLFKSKEGESYILDNKKKGLEDLKFKIKFTPTVLNDFSTRVELEVLEDDLENTDEAGLIAEDLSEESIDSIDSIDGKNNSVSDYQNEIKVSLEFIQESYIEWTQDGRLYRGRLIPAGETRSFEAKNRLEIKIGNAGGVRIRWPGTTSRLAGPVSRIVKLVYRRVPDPLDSGIHKIEELIEVIQ